MTDKEQKENLSRNLKRLLGENEKSQSEVAKVLGVSPQTFNTWVQGIAFPRPAKVQALAEYFRVSLDYLTEDRQRNRDILDYKTMKVYELAKRMDADALEKLIEFAEYLLYQTAREGEKKTGAS